MPVASSGFVLLTVLVFLQIFSLLGLYGLSSVVMTQKSNQQFWAKEAALAATNMMMLELEHELLLSKADCVRAIISAAELSSKSRAWWRENACIRASGDSAYLYFFEYLGQDPCVVIHKTDINQLVTASYYRITVVTINDHIRSPKILLQSTIAKPGEQGVLCPDKPRIVIVGVQARRELY